MKPTVCALAIGGLDPGGGAGILADVRAFTAAGAFGCAVVAVSTVQSTSGMLAARSLPTAAVVEQAREVLRHQRVRAFKLGALGSRANVEAIGALLAKHPRIPAVVDTPMLPSRGGARLLATRAIAAMKRAIVARAAVVTVNVDEVEALIGVPVTSVTDAHDAAVALCKLGARAAIVKGGHLDGANAIDVMAIGGHVIELRARRLAIAPTHGTGCTFASLIAGRLALAARADGDAIVDAVRWAKRTHHAALSNARDVGGKQRVVVF